MTQELYTRIGGDGYVASQSWPTFDPKMLLTDVIEMPVQIMGKVRGRISVPAGANSKEVENIALQDEQIATLLENVTVRKVIVVPNKIINIVAN
ncbi:MAG: leucyl-tRNA synthetase [Phycisphaerales bacterium]